MKLRNNVISWSRIPFLFSYFSSDSDDSEDDDDSSAEWNELITPDDDITWHFMTSLVTPQDHRVGPETDQILTLIRIQMMRCVFIMIWPWKWISSLSTWYDFIRILFMDSLKHRVGQDRFVMLHCVALGELCEAVFLSKLM